jgi:uncharacterized membrane protein
VFIALEVITATVAGIMVGVEFCVAVFINPILLRLTAGTALEIGPHFARVLGRVMPFWYITSLIFTAGLAAASWGTPTSGFAVAAALLLVVSVVMSVSLLVPINNRSKDWTAEKHPDDWRDQQRRWHGLHYGRVAIIMAALVLILVAVAG